MIKTKNSSSIIQHRIDMDLLKRSIAGVYIYSSLLPIIFYFYDFYFHEPTISWTITITMAFVSVLRLIHYHHTNSLYSYSTKLWLATFSVLSLSQAAILGMVFALSVGDPRFSPITNVMFLTIGGVAGGALTALMPRLWLAVVNLLFLLIPGAIVSLIIPDHTGFAVLIIIYFTYLFTLGFRSNSEYLRAFEIEFQLEQQRVKLEQLNKIDPLTQLYNRGHFNTAYEHQWNNGIRSQHQQSLLLIDIDKFKAINDNYGHLFGDECLIYISKKIHDTAKRQTDIIARFGGEEFAVLLSDTSLKEAISIAENIREKIATQPFVLNKTELSITVSIGVASIIPQSSINPNQLIENTDMYLYQAKDSGRNKVCHQR